MIIAYINKKIKSLNKSSLLLRYPNQSFFLSYTILFTVMCCAVFYFFPLNGKSFVSVTDGTEQHLNALIYYGKWLRQIVRSVVFEHQFNIPMWDMQVGYGADVITTFNYYGFGDPLTVFSVFVPSVYMVHFYNFLVLLRIFLAGGAFSIYSIYHKNNRFSTLIGALIYCFCNFALTGGLKHPFFLNAMIYLPLVLLGIDKILKDKKPFLYISMIAIAALSNFYFLYMIVIFMIIYAVFRYFMVFGKFSFKTAGEQLGKFILYSLIGILIASVILIPVLRVLFSNSRFNIDRSIPMLYESSFYWNYLKGFMSGGTGYWARLGYTGVGLTGVIVLFSKKKANTQLKAGFLLLSGFVFIPYVGHVLNGFSYVSNRWIWAYSMLCAYIIVKAIPIMLEMNRKEKLKMVLACAGWILLVLSRREIRSTTLYFGLGILITCIICICFYSKKRYNENLLRIVLLSCACLSIAVNAYVLFPYSRQGNLKRFMDMDQVNAQYTHNASTVLKDLSDTSIYRYDQVRPRNRRNRSLHQNLKSTNFYFSLVDGNITKFHREMRLTNAADYNFADLNSRVILNKIFSVKYLLTEGDQQAWIPYGYSKEFRNQEKINGQICSVYSMEHPLSFGYTYNYYIPRKEYDALSSVQRQEALLQGVVLEESDMEPVKLDLQSKKLEVTFQANKDVQIDGSTILVKKKGATVILQFEGIPNSEYYLDLTGFSARKLKQRDKYTKEQWELLGASERKAIEKSDKDRRERRVFNYQITAGDTKKRMAFMTETSPMYAGKHDFLCNMGYKQEPVNTMEISFEHAGYYSVEDLSVICQPMTNIETQTEALAAELLENVVIDGNEVTGNIQLKKDKILCFSIPYSDGWTLYVNGKEHKLKQANTMFMAAELKSGSHQIRLKYQTPSLKLGGALSVLGFMVLGGMMFYNNKDKKGRNNEQVNRADF